MWATKQALVLRSARAFRNSGSTLAAWEAVVASLSARALPRHTSRSIPLISAARCVRWALTQIALAPGANFQNCFQRSPSGPSFYTDSQYVAGVVSRGEAHPGWTEGPDGDLWKQFWKFAPGAKAIWVKAHLTQQAAEIRGIDRNVWRGNALADRLATTASHAARVDPDVRKARALRITNACLVAHTAAAVWKHYVSETRERLSKERYYSRLGKPDTVVAVERRPDFP